MKEFYKKITTHGIRRRLFTLTAVGILIYSSNAHAVIVVASQEQAPKYAVAARFSFFVATNSGSVNAFPKIKILFTTFRVWGGRPGDPADYMIETNIYSSRWTYHDYAYPARGLEGVETYDEASIRIATHDVNGQTGCKTFAPAVFPRQSYNVDGIPGLYKTDMMCQANLNGQTGTVEISRGPIITDKSGWKHDSALPDDVIFRQWNVAVTFNGKRHDMAIALPAEHSRYLCYNEMPSISTEFMGNNGAFSVYYWGFEYLRERSDHWEPVAAWTVICAGTLPGSTPAGARVVRWRGRYVLEISNTAYLSKGVRFLIP